MIISIRLKLLLVTLVAATIFVSSCGNIQKSEDTMEVHEESNKENSEKKVQEIDGKFLVRAAEINLKEIQLGQLAQEKSEAGDIKELGKMLEDAHTKSYNDLTALAKSKGIEIPNAPTDKAQDACNALNEKEKNDFDKAFSEVMVTNHKDAIEIFEKASADCNDVEIKNWIIAALPGLRSHLSHSMVAQKKFLKL